jgi:hypothetical protein
MTIRTVPQQTSRRLDGAAPPSGQQVSIAIGFDATEIL